ncbi:MAG: hypothetical protein C0462_01710 [Alcanivorax sp.]|nr:hypothetical protein [Alcanivorax sp.]
MRAIEIIACRGAKELAAFFRVGRMSCFLLVSLSLIFGGVFTPAVAMIELDEDELSLISGQALMQMEKLAGSGISSDITFYKAGLDVMLELNMNIEKLQLGCTGNQINGQYCDIDIDHLSLSGPEDCPGGRPGCSAQLLRPFFQFAIKNDDQPAFREVVGLRLSAEQATGLLTAGYQDDGMTRDESRSGINSLSGYMELASATGTGMTAQRNMSYSDTNMALQGVVEMCIGFVIGSSCIGGWGPINYTSTDYNIRVNPALASFVTAPTSIYGKRMTSARLTAEADVGNISIHCPDGPSATNCLVATALGLPLRQGVSGYISGVKAAVEFEQALNLFHNIPVNNPFSLSMQQQSVLWPDAAVPAEAGWWMAFEDPVEIGDVSAADPIVITNDVLAQLVAPINAVLGAPPHPRCSITGCLFGTVINVGQINLSPYFSNPANYVNMPLSDLKLSAQNVTPNCWGGARFC